MISNKNTEHFLKELRQQHPSAFTRNFVFYGQIKTKGILDEPKELVPFALALILFAPLSYLVSQVITAVQPNYEGFQSGAIATLIIMLLFMTVSPFVLKQIKHSSVSLYTQLKTTPLKITALILLQAINIIWIESWLMQGILFFFAMRFGFIQFCKENMFRETTTPEQFKYIQEIRRICYWSYKQSIKLRFKLMFTSKSSQRYITLLNKKLQIASLHTELINYENKLCMAYKHTDIDKYLDELM